MKKLLFIAGEPGCGKTEGVARPLGDRGLGLVLSSDAISERAAKHYERNKSLGCQWQLWKHEFDRADRRVELDAALCKSLDERKGSPIDRQSNVICEGVLSGHPTFRQIIQVILPRYGFSPDKVLTLAIRVPWVQVQQNLKKRDRPEDQDFDFVKARSKDYLDRLANQVDVACFATTEACYEAAAKFLGSSTMIAG